MPVYMLLDSLCRLYSRSSVAYTVGCSWRWATAPCYGPQQALGLATALGKGLEFESAKQMKSLYNLIFALHMAARGAQLISIPLLTWKDRKRLESGLRPRLVVFSPWNHSSICITALIQYGRVSCAMPMTHRTIQINHIYRTLAELACTKVRVCRRFELTDATPAGGT